MKLEISQVQGNRDISRIFNVCMQKGIRYGGNLRTGIKHVVLVTVLHKTCEDSARIPYEDRKIGDRLSHTGEERYGDQKISKGNLVLKQQMERGYPIYVFEKKSPGNAFLGRYKSCRLEERVSRRFSRK